MANFSQEIDSFERYGTYTYGFDQAGNVVLNPSSSNFDEVYLSLPINNFAYDNKKIESFYNPNFEEFIPSTPIAADEAEIPADVTELQEEVTKLTQDNQALTEQLDEMISRSEASSTESEIEAFKQVILGLRIKLEEGKTENDFESEFPYGPIDTSK